MGIVASRLLSVSLLPDIDIPEVTINVAYPNTSARELESVVIEPLRNRLLTLTNLKDIECETRDGNSVIHLKFDYGTKADYAFLEVNEQVDRAMGILPSDVKRPQVIKASASDIPLFYLNLSLKHSVRDSDEEARFLQLSEFAGEVIRKRIEQLPQVAMVDLTGRSFPEIQILPDQEKLLAMNISLEQISQALRENNVSVGNILVREGQHQYYINFATYLRTPEDVGKIFLKVDEHILQLKEVASVHIHPQQRRGVFLSNQDPAIGMAIIKQADARIEELNEKMKELIHRFQEDYPDIQFTLSQDQTELLNVSLLSLKQSLLIGSFLAFLVMFFFLRDIRIPWLIGLTIPTALIFSLFIFYLIDLSINIISLSGLILGVGLMIDNSIIVIDNISQHMEGNTSLERACIQGTNEVIRPLISSSLTTSAVFIPLIFLSGISGALFYDQAIAITIGLGASLMVSITLLPTIYRQIHLFSRRKKAPNLIQRRHVTSLVDAYEKSIGWILKNRWLVLLGFCMFPILSVFLYQNLPLERLPQVEQTELLLTIDWNENISIEENKQRILKLLQSSDTTLIQSNSLIGQQQFALNSDMQQQMDEATLYLSFTTENGQTQCKRQLETWISNVYPAASFSFDTPPNIFDRLFSGKQVPLIAKVGQRGTRLSPPIDAVNEWIIQANQDLGTRISFVPTQDYIAIKVLHERLILYEVDLTLLYNTLKSAFQAFEIEVLRSQQQMIPVVFGKDSRVIEEIIQESLVRNTEGQLIPISSLVELVAKTDYPSLYAGKGGGYFPIDFDTDPQSTTQLLTKIQQHIFRTNQLDVSFAGSGFENQELLKELLVVMGVSLLLLYFILAAQFESVLQPLIVLLEIPIDIGGALLLLWLLNSSINLLSMIGIVVMSGIIINDSILKIDTINQLRKKGMPLNDALREGGARRLKPILMTSLTTILAVTPFLFQEGLGADLQKPLALSLIGGMILGTFVSLYFIPLAYQLTERVSVRNPNL